MFVSVAQAQLIRNDDRRIVEADIKQPRSDIHIFKIVSVDEFYGMLPVHVDKMDAFKRRLNKELELATDRRIVPVPTVGMYCATNVDGAWYRAKVLKTIDGGQYDVYLIDVAQRTCVAWHNLFYLKKEYMSPAECIVQMSLHDINGDDAAKSAMTAKFMDIHKDFKSFTVKFEQSSLKLCYSVTLYAIDNGSQSQRVCVNHVLNKSTAAPPPRTLSSMGSLVRAPKAPAIDPPHSAEMVTKRKVIVTHYKSPGEFYVMLADLEKRRRNIEFEIQASMGNGFVSHHLNWKARDRCYVKRGQTWCRGVVIECVESMCSVHLEDYGETITASMPEELVEVKVDSTTAPRMAIKCHLAFLKPTTKDTWSRTAIDQFKAYCDQFLELSISIPAQRHTTISLGVVLWGYSDGEIRAFEPIKHTYRNINRDMLYKGLAASTTTDNDVFHIHDCVEVPEAAYNDWLIEDIIKHKAANKRLPPSDQSAPSSGASKRRSAAPIGQKMFRATPVYIGKDMRIYTQTEAQMQCCDHMADTLTKWHQDRSAIPKITTWQVGEACVAQFRDGMYHRAQVVAVDAMEQTCEVRTRPTAYCLTEASF